MKGDVTAKYGIPESVPTLRQRRCGSCPGRVSRQLPMGEAETSAHHKIYMSACHGISWMIKLKAREKASEDRD